MPIWRYDGTLNRQCPMLQARGRGVISYRPFRNTDQRRIVEIWRSHGRCRSLVQPMTMPLFDEFVLAKPYFDRHGLIVAVDDARVVGFGHAAFGPTADGKALDPSAGIVCMVMAQRIAEQSDADRAAIERGLFAEAERFLTARGAATVQLGGVGRDAPFYFGLYGGSEPGGVMDSDESFAALGRWTQQECAYSPVDTRLIWQREMATFRPVVDRNQMQIRRRANIEPVFDPPASSWWEACMLGPIDRQRFQLIGRDSGAVWARADFTTLDAFSAMWGVRAMGLLRVEVEATQRREGLATFLLGEALKALQQQGVALVETHTYASDVTSGALFRKLGFVEADRGTIYRRQLGGRT